MDILTIGGVTLPAPNEYKVQLNDLDSSDTGRTEDGVFLSQRAVHLVSTERTRGMNAARGYGFHITKRQNPFLGLLWPSDGYGLRDPASGSAIAVSPLDGFFTVILMNGAYTPANRAEGERFLRLCLNAAYAAFQHETGCEDCE